LRVIYAVDCQIGVNFAGIAGIEHRLPAKGAISAL
jgi:hypothetical protein